MAHLRSGRLYRSDPAASCRCYSDSLAPLRIPGGAQHTCTVRLCSTMTAGQAADDLRFLRRGDVGNPKRWPTGGGYCFSSIGFSSFGHTKRIARKDIFGTCGKWRLTSRPANAQIGRELVRSRRPKIGNTPTPRVKSQRSQLNQNQIQHSTKQTNTRIMLFQKFCPFL